LDGLEEFIGDDKPQGYLNSSVLVDLGDSTTGIR